MHDRRNPGGVGRRTLLGALALPLAAPLLGGAGEADKGKRIRIGLLRTLSPAPLYIAKQEDDFRTVGLDPEFRFFDAAQPIAAAAVAGDIDVGLTALTGGFFSLAGRAQLRVIGGGLHEEKGIEGTAILASNTAFAAGLTTPAKLGGHSVGITQYGSSFHYMIGRIAEIEHFPLASVTLRPLQDISNMVAAVRTGQVDATFAIASQARPLAAKGEAHIIGWVGDILPYQLTALFTTAAMIRDHGDLLRAFAKAYGEGVDTYRHAFFRRKPDGAPVHDASTDAAIAAIQHYVYIGDPDGPQKILAGVGYYDAGGALDAADVREQLRWFTDQGLVKQGPPADQLIDTEFLPTLQTSTRQMPTQQIAGPSTRP